MTTFPSQVLEALNEQHAMLRTLIRRCELLADDVDGGYTAPRVLWEATDELRQALDAHNRHEERVLKPLLLELDAFGEIRIERMLLEHVGEHLAINERLRASTTIALRDALSELRDHLDEEERYFVTSRVLHDDLVTLEHGG
jgi:hypothetical protein